jgi:hypothetical protein
MPCNLTLSHGGVVAVREDVADIMAILKKDQSDYGHVFREFKMANNTNEVRRIRLSAIVEVTRGHSA